MDNNMTPWHTLEPQEVVGSTPVRQGGIWLVNPDGGELPPVLTIDHLVSGPGFGIVSSLSDAVLAKLKSEGSRTEDNLPKLIVPQIDPLFEIPFQPSHFDFSSSLGYGYGIRDSVFWNKWLNRIYVGVSIPLAQGVVSHPKYGFHMAAVRLCGLTLQGRRMNQLYLYTQFAQANKGEWTSSDIQRREISVCHRRRGHSRVRFDVK